MSDLFSFTDESVKDIYNVVGFPLGIAVIGYLGTAEGNKSSYIIIEEFFTPLSMEKSQRAGELQMIGRNTPVLQMMGGEGLKFVNCQGMIRGAAAHEKILAFSGLVDKGDPLWFACDKWIRQVIIKNLAYEMHRHHTWYNIRFELWKYEAIDILSYKRTISDLSPFPDFDDGDATTPPFGSTGEEQEKISNPVDKDIDKKDDMLEIKNSEGELLFKVPASNTCRMITISQGMTWEELIKQNYGNMTQDEVLMIVQAIKLYNYQKNGIPGNRYQCEGTSGEMDPVTSFRVCFPNEIIFPGPPEKSFKTK